MEHAAERLLSSVADARRGQGRRIDVLAVGDVPDELIARMMLSGAVRSVTREHGPADFAVVQYAPDIPHAVGYFAAGGIVLFDPKATRPIDAIRWARCAWADIQPWVLPIEGPDAFSEGVILTSAAQRAGVPRISCSMPVNLERHDVERVLASFLPIAAEWVVGVDTKSDDGTREIVERYADVSFPFTIKPWSFAAARNLTLDRCSFPWIFQTEGHEHLPREAIGSLSIIGNFRLPVGVLMVARDVRGGDHGEHDQTFHFPWVFRNHPRMRFVDQNGVHNSLDFPKYAEEIGSRGVVIRGPDEIRTIHKAHPENRQARHSQAVEMNRTALEDFAKDATGAGEARARFYAMQEHQRAGKDREAIRAGIRYLRVNDAFHEQAYEAHLTIGDLLYSVKKPRRAIGILKRALALDLNRIEAEILLADCHHAIGELETARQLYSKASGVPMPAYSNLFLRKRCYLGVPWIGLAFVCYKIGDLSASRAAARMALHYEPGHEKCRELASMVFEGETPEEVEAMIPALEAVPA